MPQNIEVKAHARDFPRQYELASQISDSPLKIIQQKDTFFSVGRGRLKLREFSDGTGDLIAYFRTDSAEVRDSSYEIYRTSNPASLLSTLSKTNAVIGIVEKSRHLFMVGQTRIHMDRVLGLGEFIELEYVLREDEPHAAGQDIVESLMQTLEINDSDILSEAYIDLLSNQG